MTLKQLRDRFMQNWAVPYYMTIAGIAPDGTIYLADRNRHIVWRLSGQKTTVLSGGDAGYRDGPGTVARFNAPELLGTDLQGNSYIRDTGNNCFRKIAPNGYTITITEKNMAEIQQLLSCFYMEWFCWKENIVVVKKHRQGEY